MIREEPGSIEQRRAGARPPLMLIADIGGTHARFQVLGNGVDPTAATVYRCADFDGVLNLVDSHLASLTGPVPTHACLAVAGPISGDRVALTNRDWAFSRADLQRRLGLQQLEVINDFAAVAASLARLGPEDCTEIIGGLHQERCPRAVIGAGTGIGVAVLSPQGNDWQPMAGEGGHASIAPNSALEFEVLLVLRETFSHVSAETVLSGPGIANLHKALCVVLDRSVEALRSEEITAAALNGRDGLCQQTIHLYAGLLGGFAGDVALTFGATGGLYLCGDVLRHIAPLLRCGAFAERFVAKGPMTGFLREIPVRLIGAEQPGLLGAAAWLEARVSTS